MQILAETGGSTFLDYDQIDRVRTARDDPTLQVILCLAQPAPVPVDLAPRTPDRSPC